MSNIASTTGAAESSFHLYVFAGYLGTLLLALAVAGYLADRVKLPSVLGFIVASLGSTYLLHVVGLTPDLTTKEVFYNLAEVGAATLLAAAGVHFDAQKIRRTASVASRVALTGVAVPILLGTFVARGMFPEVHSWLPYIYMGLCMSATSVGIPLAIMKGRHQDQSRAGQIITAAGIIDDILPLLGFTLLLELSKSTGALDIWTIVIKVIVVLVYINLSLTILKSIVSWIARLLNGVPDTTLRGVFIFGLILVNISLGELAGVSALICGFCAGLQLDEVHFTTHDPEIRVMHVDDLIQVISIPFVSVFFMNIGFTLQWEVVTPQLVLLGVLFAALVPIAGKLTTMLVAEKGSRQIVGLGMAHIAEVGLSLAALGQLNNILTPEMYAVTAIAAVTTLLTMPVVFNWQLGKQDLDVI